MSPFINHKDHFCIPLGMFEQESTGYVQTSESNKYGTDHVPPGKFRSLIQIWEYFHLIPMIIVFSWM